VEVPVVEIPAHTRTKRGRKPLPDHLPRIEIIHDLPEDQKVCACGTCLKRIGEEVSEKLDYVPAVMQVERHIRPKYACPSCDGEEGMPVVRIAPMPPQIIPKGMATPSRLAQVITAKFVDAMPLYRQTKQFARLGVDIPRHSMSGWAMAVAKALEPLHELFYKVEHNIKELSPKEKVSKRREQAVPILDAIRAILDKRIDHVPPKSLLGQAMTYARNQWNRAIRYVDCGLLTPDNNAAESAIRPVALGRKNCLFAGVPKGADASAMLFSLVETAKANEIEPQAYLKFLFERFPAAQTTEDMKALMPQHVDKSLLPSLPKPSRAKSKDPCFYCRSGTSNEDADA